MSKLVAMLAYDQAQILDITGPLEVFARTARWLRDNGLSAANAYTVELLSPSGGLVTTSSGLQLASKSMHQFRRPIHTLLVTGGVGYAQTRDDADVRRWITRRATSVERLGSICTGAMILAACGLLKGKSATTHWAYCDELANAHADIDVDGDAIYVRNNNVYTSAGVTAGIDMALAMVEEDWGRRVALAVARELVLFLKRPGGQAQFSSSLAAQIGSDSRFADLELWIREHPEEDLRVDRLARRTNMSRRHFARAFKRVTGITPASFVEDVRLERAREYLSASNLGLATIAERCGLGSADTLRRSFARKFGYAPSVYRRLHQ